MPKKRKTSKPHGRNLIAERVEFLRKGGDLETGQFKDGVEALTQKQLAEKVAAAIENLLPSSSPLKQRQQQKEQADKGDVPFFRREDISKIEAGTRHVRDYELAALAAVLKVSLNELTGIKEKK